MAERLEDLFTPGSREWYEARLFGAGTPADPEKTAAKTREDLATDLGYFTPGIGEALSARDAWRASGRGANAFSEGRYMDAAGDYVHMLGATLGAAPFVGTAARATKRGTDWMDKAFSKPVNAFFDNMFNIRPRTGPLDETRTLHTFAGIKADTADLNAYMRAARMKKEGADRQAIWDETGWFQGADGKWRFEIDDSAAMVRPYNQTAQQAQSDVRFDGVINDDAFSLKRAKEMEPYTELTGRELDDMKTEFVDQATLLSLAGQREPAKAAARNAFAMTDMTNEMQRRLYGPMSEYLDHPALFDAYPGAAALHTRLQRDANPGSGYYHPGDKVQGGTGEQIGLSRDPKKNILPGEGTTLHELQHYLQRQEGFATGGSPAMFSQGDEALKARDALSARREIDYAVERGLLPKDHSLDQAKEVINREYAGIQMDPPSDRAIGMAYHRDIYPDDKLSDTIRFYGLDKRIEPFSPREGYERLAGEVEARNVETRRHLTAEQRRAIPPWETQEIHDKKQIVTGNAFANPEMAIPAWHGSPHDFDRFQLDKIGTGEGAQAYGHGLYFAENPATAKSYAETLGTSRGLTLDGQPISDPLIQSFATAKAKGNDLAKDLEFQKNKVVEHTAIRDSWPEWSGIRKQHQFAIDEHQANVDAIEKVLGGEVKAPGGRLYKTELDVEPEDLLDWDKPLSQQSEKIQQAIEKLPLDLSTRAAIDRGDPVSIDLLYRGVEAKVKSDAAAAQAFREAGIPGIRYLDQGSRGGGEGTRNFVMFDDKLVKILEKDGQPVAQAPRLPVRGPSEDVYEVMDAQFNYGRDAGDMDVGIDTLKGGVTGSPDDLARVDDLVRQMQGPDGYISRLIVDHDGNVVEGQHRLEALRRLGVDTVPVRRIEDMTEGLDVPAVMDALKPFSLRSEHQSQLVRNALEMVADSGSGAAALREYELARGWEDQYRAVLEAIDAARR